MSSTSNLGAADTVSCFTTNGFILLDDSPSRVFGQSSRPASVTAHAILIDRNVSEKPNGSFAKHGAVTVRVEMLLNDRCGSKDDGDRH